MTLNFASDSSEAKGGFVLQYELCKNAIIFQKSKYVSPNIMKSILEEVILLFIDDIKILSSRASN